MTDNKLNVWGVQIYSNFMVTLPVSIGTLWSYIIKNGIFYNKL